jgi:quinol monooxygenase YgiN
MVGLLVSARRGRENGKIMKITVFGASAVGGRMAARLIMSGHAVNVVLKRVPVTLVAAAWLGLLVAGLAIPRAASAQTEAPPTYDLIFIEVMPQDVAKAITLLKAEENAARDGVGNAGFLILQRDQTPTQFAIVGRWKDNESLGAYQKSSSTQNFQSEIAPLLISPYDERPHAALLTDAEQDDQLFTHPGKKTVVVLTHIDVFAVKRPQGINLVTALRAKSQRQPGSLTFDVLNQSSRANHFTLFEAWNGQASLSNYLTQKFVFEFRSSELEITGSLYDQRIFNIIQ